MLKYIWDCLKSLRTRLPSTHAQILLTHARSAPCGENLGWRISASGRLGTKPGGWPPTEELTTAPQARWQCILYFFKTCTTTELAKVVLCNSCRLVLVKVQWFVSPFSGTFQLPDSCRRWINFFSSESFAKKNGEQDLAMMKFSTPSVFNVLINYYLVLEFNLTRPAPKRGRTPVAHLSLVGEEVRNNNLCQLSYPLGHVESEKWKRECNEWLLYWLIEITIYIQDQGSPKGHAPSGWPFRDGPFGVVPLWFTY